VGVDDEHKKLSEFFEESIQDLTTDLEQFLRPLEEAKKPDLFRRFIAFLKQSHHDFNFVLNIKHIKNLIQAAKHIESSLRTALLIIGLVKADAK
jgi:TATA-binding protein-associated factor Taf7